MGTAFNEAIIIDEISGSVRVLRGGAWLFFSGLGAAERSWWDAAPEYAYIGFRVATYVPEPSTGPLVIGGLLGLAGRRTAQLRTKLPPVSV